MSTLLFRTLLRRLALTGTTTSRSFVFFAFFCLEDGTTTCGSQVSSLGTPLGFRREVFVFPVTRQEDLS